VLLVGVVLISALSVPLFRGRLSALAEVRFRALWVVVTAVGVQVAITTLFPGGTPGFHRVAHIASYFLAAWFVVANRRIPGLWLVAVGGGLNLLAISVNGGVMPVLPAAAATAGLAGGGAGFHNSAVLVAPNLVFLGDIFALPPGFPLHNVFSVGDICIALGVLVALHRICASRLIPAGGNMAELRHNRPFLRLWGAQAVSDLGDWVYALAVVTALNARGGTPQTFAFVLVLQFAPSAVVGALGGPLIDRFSRRKLMIVADVVRASAVGSLLLAGPPSTAHLYAVAFVLGLFGALFLPSAQASLPNVVPEDRLVAANALVTTTFHLAVMAGPVLGAVLVSRLGIAPAFAINAASFAISALLIQGLRLPAPAIEEGSRSGPVAAMLDGARYILATPLVRGIFVVLGFLMIASGIKSPIEPLFVLRALHQPVGSLGLVGGAWGIGMVLGSLAAPTISRRWARERLFGASIAIVGVAILLASRQSTLGPVLLLWVVAGVGNGLGTVSYESLLQERVPDAFRGRVLAASGAVLDGAFIAGAFAAGSLGASFGVRAALVASGALFIGAAALAGALVVPARGRQVEGTKSSQTQPAGAAVG
jgi:MFS family permease